MKMGDPMRFNILSVFALCFSSIAFAGADFKLVRELHTLSVYPGMNLVGGKLYTTDTDKDYRSTVEIYTGDGSVHLKSILLKHSATFMSAYGEKGVIVTGRTSDPWASHMTLITEVSGGSFAVKHTNFGQNVIVESSVSDGRDIFFNEKGSRGIYKLVSGRLSKMPFEVSGPGNNMQLANGALYLVELRDLFSPGDESIVEFNTQSNNFRRIAGSQQFYGLQNITLVDGKIAGTETYTNEVVFLDAAANKVIGRHAVKEGAYGIDRLGKCAVAVSDDSKTIAFLKAGDNEVEIVGGWDLNPAGDRLKQPRSLAIDQSTGRIFVRSNYPCASCTVTQSSVYLFDDGGEMLASCK